MSLQKVQNSCTIVQKYKIVPTWNSKAHNDYNMRSWKDNKTNKQNTHTHTQEKTQQIVELYIEP